MNKVIVAVLLVLNTVMAVAQSGGGDNIKIDYSKPKKYTIADITVTGVKYLNTTTLVNLSGLQVGQEIEVPGDAISKSLEK